MLHWLQKKRYRFSPFSIKKILCKYRRFILVQWSFWSNMIKFQLKTIYSIFHFVKNSDVCPCYIVHSRATKNPIHLWLAFPILDNCGVCHFEEIEYRQKRWNIEHISICPLPETLCENMYFLFESMMYDSCVIFPQFP